VTRLLRLLAVGVLVLGGSALLTIPTASALRVDPVGLEASAAAVGYAKPLVLTATLTPAQPDAQVDFYARVAGSAPRLLGSVAAGGEGRAKLTLPVTRTATYYAVLVVAGVATTQSPSVDVVVAPALKLNVVRVIGPVTHFTVTVKPVADGVPVALQHLVGKRWKTVEKGLTSDGEFTWTVGVPPDTTSKWRVFVRGSAKYGESTSKAVRVVGP
jgi:hypothetical protein